MSSLSALTDYTKLKNFSKLDWNKKNEPESFLIVYSCSNDLLYYEKKSFFDFDSESLFTFNSGFCPKQNL